MIVYVTLGSGDIARSRAFYDVALAPLDIVRHVEDEGELGYGPANLPKSHLNCRLYIVKPFNGLPATWGNGAMTCFEAPSQAAVDAFHKAGLAMGGFDEGAPGLRPYRPGFYAAYLRDPDGNKLSALHES
jgi:catechol 2,3-dioxygenase-like lactoylglutathione lyase family enzyme